MSINFLDLQRENKKILKKILQQFEDVISHSDFIFGEQVELFEKEFAKYLHIPYCISVASGTDGILLALLALNVKRDDEVIVPTFTFSASVTPIIFLGAKPILIDTLENSPTIDPEKIESAITKKTKAIIIVHLHGIPCDMDKIKRISKKYHIPIIEDAAQAHGSMYKEKLAGTIGNIGVFSFYPTKNLGAFGDGGAIVTASSKIARTLRLLRNHGQSKKNVHKILGMNSRLDTFQAVVLRAKLPLLEGQNKKRRQHASLYRRLLSSLPLRLVEENKDHVVNYHIFTVQTEKRDSLKKFLEKRGIFCGLYYPTPIHLQPFYISMFGKSLHYPHAEKFSREHLALPLYPQLLDSEIRTIAKNIKEYFQKT